MQRSFYGVTTNPAGQGYSYYLEHNGVPCQLLKFSTKAARDAWAGNKVEGYPAKEKQIRFSLKSTDRIYDRLDKKRVRVGKA